MILSVILVRNKNAKPSSKRASTGIVIADGVKLMIFAMTIYSMENDAVTRQKCNVNRACENSRKSSLLYR